MTAPAPAAPDGLVKMAQAVATLVAKLHAAPEVRAAIAAVVQKDLIPFVNTATGQEVSSIAAGFLHGLGKVFAGPAAAGIEHGADLTIEQLVAIATAITPPGAHP